jgi:site-specific DNA-methyltransferase (adenine-specific)
MKTPKNIAKGVDLHAGDCLDVLASMADATFDSCVTDPPYHLTSIVKRFGAQNAAPAKAGKTGAYKRASAGFMGKQWDGGDIAFRPELWAEVLRVLKPGAHLLAFSGTRTYHRMACAIEDAGFEIRDQIGWAYGSGFPKSHNQKGDWKGWGTALKPAWEPIVLARKPLSEGTVAANVLRWRTGALNIDGCRIGFKDGDTTASGVRAGQGSGHATANSDEHIYHKGLGGVVAPPHAAGRWPANIVHDGSEEVVAAFPDAPGQLAAVGPQHGPKGSINVYGDYGPRDEFNPRKDSGSAARFFYTAKADADDRLGSKHPTVKPLDLMQWLVRLVTPPAGWCSIHSPAPAPRAKPRGVKACAPS